MGAFSSQLSFRGHNVSSLTGLLRELSELFRVRRAMAMGSRRARALGELLTRDAPDLLGIFRKEEDENAHSDVLRWLLDCSEAPTIAPRLLERFASHCSPQAEWRSCIDVALRVGGISTRREVVVGQRDGDQTNLERIDLVVSGHGFVIGIENKVNAAEHEGQTLAYANWLRSIKGVRAGGIFLSPSGVPAQSRDFAPISYLKITEYLLDAVTATTPTAAETFVLRAYLRTLGRRILKSEFKNIVEVWREV
jgi:hypothetical protein